MHYITSDWLILLCKLSIILIFILLFYTQSLPHLFLSQYHQSQPLHMDQSIEITVRIKPCSMSLFSSLCGWDSHSIQVTDRNQFTFDSVIEPHATQDSVFDKVGMRIIANILEGYNGCIFAYGQTGSGKTFTMTGDPNNEGLVQKCLKKLWNCVKSSEFF